MNGIKQPLVSIIVNCYNSDKFLKETLESVISQTYQNWEVVFWDNQSTDSSADYFKSYEDSRFKYYYAPEHTPLSASRNFAIEKSTGEFLAFLDCDDLWTPDKLELQVAEIERNDEVGFVYSLFELFYNVQDESVTKQIKYYESILIKGHSAKNLFSELLVQNQIIFSSVLLRRSTFEQIGEFNPTFNQNEDYEVLLKASLFSLAICIDKPLVKYRIHSNNNSLKNGELNFLENEIIFKSLPPNKEVNEAISRNRTRYILYRIVFQKKYFSVFHLLNFKFLSSLFQIVKKRLKA
ncbi:hypothetical protein DHW03_11605 [Pedobacter yonginense]|uniref:Glycosyltransferase 2-like domain-containing protein n=1 Tax=Pedobacter yonginense TaxID=651869 RepID=A0A317ESP7_9SPHI|nr:glycosyltransferase [Pedobacter yonginense]PWS28188.1 hypothetical protein DHW03_11605 [Pedobacter yonginense]